MKFSLARQRAFDQTLREKDFVLVYQMGKVGSSSIEASLEHAGIPSWHIHTFDDNEEFQMYRNTADVACFFDWPVRTAYRLTLAHRCRVLQKRDYLKIITLVRDPVATVVSRFFQDLHIQFISGKKNDAIHGDIDATLKHLTDAFENQMHLDYFTEWFDRELKRRFGVDVLKHISDPTQTHWHIEQNGCDVLLMKCEAINQSADVLATFLDHPEFTLESSNEGSNKWYSALYQRFKETYSFERLFHLYDAPLYRAVYSEEEITRFKNKWSK
ncbi:capsular biosynthesis protein [Enterovibrio norvegicus FF-33]|uniref:Capsular biosynthesis protein n=1 Tax=Enterovibrio norvegicus FF-454 TaxID=1185651 RepID=A0A1E5BXP5_9GAMM|nr:putative capsular polysaccharide synthesis family protein [Enterovibrio norvegicus]OEE58001.1 capsular biosynthesis protein [Enterovibrio norvegicus FF-454]OEE70639.1 capsular biosynthesis protein [Enterovibrio norvegicus FF-33]OEE79685.1 capsular biosynthesis protein [Enterovibrio norvegicus FF-162]